MKIRFQILTYLFLLFPFIAFTQTGSNEASEGDTAAVIQPEVIALVDINNRVEATRQIILDKSSDLELSGDIKLIDSLLLVKKSFLTKEAREFREYNSYNLSKFFLENTYRAWEGYHEQLNQWKSKVNNGLSRSQIHISDLDFIRKEWELTLDFAKENEEPMELQSRISEIVLHVDSLIQAFNKKNDGLIYLEIRITDAMSFSNTLIENVEHLQQHLRDSLLIARVVPLWEINLSGGNIGQLDDRVSKFWYENAKIFRNYFQSLNLTLYLIVLLIILLMFYQLRRQYFRLGYNDSEPGFASVRRIMINNYFPTIIAIMIFLYSLMFPYNPIALTGIMSLVGLICMRYILNDFIGPDGRRMIWILVILLFINQLEIIMWYFSDLARIYILLEASAVLAGAILFINPKARKKLMKESAFMRNTVRMGYLVFILAAIAFLANIFGYLDLSVLLIKIGIQSSVFIVIVYGLVKIFKSIIISIVALIRATQSTVLLKYLGKFESRAISVLNLLTVLFLIKLTLTVLEVYRPVLNWLIKLLSDQWLIGTLEISLGGILLLILILSVTLIISKIIKVVIEDAIAPHTKLPKGVPFAISVTIRYFLVVLGFIMALSAAGINLGNFGLMAGALGIGIGFGLQDIVNNFFSGLIMVYERPVQVGDTIEVENLLGEVKSIGVRSSKVKTYDGAEVVVPNGNLISNQLINWTLSDNRRRLEVQVGVSYGSDPNIVLELLKKVALSHENVLKEPEPLPLFEAFGDSSLNFRLLFWVYFNEGFTTKSDIAIGIYNILNENNITIPFPQVDLNVKRDA